MSRKESTIKTAQVNFRIDPETKQMFKDYAKKEHMPYSNWLVKQGVRRVEELKQAENSK